VFDFLPDWWATEPVRFGSALVIFVNSVIALGVGLDWLQLDGNQVSLLYLVVLNAVVLFAGEGVRRRVSPSDTDPVEDA